MVLFLEIDSHPNMWEPGKRRDARCHPLMMLHKGSVTTYSWHTAPVSIVSYHLPLGISPAAKQIQVQNFYTVV